MKKIVYIIIVLLAIIACNRRLNWIDKDNKGYGYVPIYASKTDIAQIAFQSSKPTANPGKIYAYGNYIFQNDLGAGVHIIDNTNKLNPVKTGFINIPYNYEISIKDSFLYANNLADLVVFDLHNPTNPKVVNKINGVFPNQGVQNYPDEQDVYFECVDTTKGILIGWKKQTTINRTCYR